MEKPVPETREELRAKVAKAMTDIADYVYKIHCDAAGCNHVSSPVMRSVGEVVDGLKKELGAIRELCELYFKVEPDRRWIVTGELRDINAAIDEYYYQIRRAHQNVHYDVAVRYYSVPVYRPITDSFCRFARSVLGIYPAGHEYIGQQTIMQVTRRPRID